MRLFLDTEFCSFENPELISIGVIDENSREFYAELTDFSRQACSDFVVETVLPLLGQHFAGYVSTRQNIAYRLSQWLEEYRDWPGGVTICVDYATDWYLFVDLLAHSPVMEFITVENIWNQLDLPKIQAWWTETGLPQHHALNDAKANRHGYTPATGK